MEDRVRVAVVGCGLIGRRRAEVVQRSPDDELVIVADVDEGRAKSLAREMGCLTTTDWQEAVARDDVDVIIAATPNKYLMPITVAALDSGKHVLCEKPPGRNPTEARQMVDAAQRSGRILKIGFNHRHHPAIWKAHELCAQGAIGPLTFIRAVYGHGGRPGYDREWRADPDLAGGGELLDQGVHIVDLCRWFLGEFAEVFGFVGTYFWNLGYAPVSDKTYAVESQTVGRVGRRPYRDQVWRSLRRFLVSIRPFRSLQGLLDRRTAQLP